MTLNYTNPFNFKPIPSITPKEGDYWQNGTWKFGALEITPDTAYAPSFVDIILSGNTALTLVNAIADGVNYLKLFGGTELLSETYIDSVTAEGKCEQRNLPEGHQQVEYIEFTGSQYVNIGISGNATIKITAQASAIKGSSQALIASTAGASGGSWFGEFTNNQKWGVGTGNGLSTIAPTTKITAVLTFGDNGFSFETQGGK